MRPTPADNLPILTDIPPVELRCNGATLSLALRAMEAGHLLHSTSTCPSSANARRLKSRHSFVPAAQQLISLSDNQNIRAAHWTDHQWNAKWRTTIGVGASKFLGVQRIFAQIFPNLPKKLSSNFCGRFFGVTSIKIVFTCFSASVGCHFCLDFQGFCLDIRGFCSDFQGFCPECKGFSPNVRQIKIFGGALAPPPLTPLRITLQESVLSSPTPASTPSE